MTSWQICILIVFISIFVQVVARKSTVDRINMLLSPSKMFFYTKKLTIKLASILAVLNVEKTESLVMNTQIFGPAQNVTL
jgi:hypothetical protein